MSIVSLLVALALVAFFAWLLIRFIPMTPEGRNVIIGVSALIMILIALNAFGILGGLTGMRVPTVR